MTPRVDVDVVKDLYVLENAKQKALEVLARVNKDTDKAKPVVIGCDTVVVLDGVILEKPKDEDDAFDMLTKLSGRAHDVYSGVALFTPALGEQQPHLFFERTAVAFGPLEPQDIRGDTAKDSVDFDVSGEDSNDPVAWLMVAYIATGEPMDKAGAYGLQGASLSTLCRMVACGQANELRWWSDVARPRQVLRARAPRVPQQCHRLTRAALLPGTQAARGAGRALRRIEQNEMEECLISVMSIHSSCLLCLIRPFARRQRESSL